MLCLTVSKIQLDTQLTPERTVNSSVRRDMVCGKLMIQGAVWVLAIGKGVCGVLVLTMFYLVTTVSSSITECSCLRNVDA